MGATASTTTWCATNTLVLPGMGAGVVRVKGDESRALALSVDCNGGFRLSRSVAGRRSPWLRPRATWRAPAREPIGATNCLNFGNPQRPEIMWQFGRAVEGMGRGVPGEASGFQSPAAT